MMGATGEIYALSPDVSEGADRARQLFDTLLPEHASRLLEEDETQLVRQMVNEAKERSNSFMKRPRKRRFGRFEHDD